MALGGHERACLFLNDEPRIMAVHPKLVKRAKVIELTHASYDVCVQSCVVGQVACI